MRIIIDMQGAQTESRFRGIGRYVLSMVESIIKNRGDHEIILVLNGLLLDGSNYVKEYFSKYSSSISIKEWYSPYPVAGISSNNHCRLAMAKIIRESFIYSLRPDAVLITSYFEGYMNESVLSIKDFDVETKVSVIVYDLIPLVWQHEYLCEKGYRDFYLSKVNEIKKSDLILTISDYSRDEIKNNLIYPSKDIVNISAAADTLTSEFSCNDTVFSKLANKLNINRKYIMYTGGADPRKNLSFLARAYSLLSDSLKSEYQLVFVGKISEREKSAILKEVDNIYLDKKYVLFTGYVTDSELSLLYANAQLFVFPSLCEGFGLPVLEAASFDVPVITSNTSSMPEIIRNKLAYFDPYDVFSLVDKMTNVLMNKEFCENLKNLQKNEVSRFSWDFVGQSAIDAIESMCGINTFHKRKITADELYCSIIDEIISLQNLSEHISEEDLIACAFSIEGVIKNKRNCFD